MKRCITNSIKRNIDYDAMEKAGFKTAEPMMVQYAKEYAKKIEETKRKKNNGQEIQK